MNRILEAGLLVVALAAGAAGTAAEQRAAAERIVAGWPNGSRQAAEGLLAEYGGPDLVDVGRLDWNERGGFKKIIVRAWPGINPGVVQHTVRYAVPADAGILALKDSVVVPDRTAGVLSAFSGKEATNILALNTADRVLSGRANVAQARQAYGRSLELRAAGKSSPETQRILFNVKGPPGRP